MIDDIIDGLTSELTITDQHFNADLLRIKVNAAYDEVMGAKNYPSDYTSDMVIADMLNYKRQIRNIALYDYNKVGADFENGHSENGTNRTYSDRDKLFSGVIPIARV